MSPCAGGTKTASYGFTDFYLLTKACMIYWKTVSEGNTPHRHTQFSLPVYWTIRPINRWLWGGHVKQSDWTRASRLLIAWHPCPCPCLPTLAVEMAQWEDWEQQLLCGLTLLEGTEVGGWRLDGRVDGWQHREYSSLIDVGFTARKGYVQRLPKEWAEAVPGHDIQMYIKPGKLTMQMFLEPHPREEVGRVPHPPPQSSQLGLGLTPMFPSLVILIRYHISDVFSWIFYRFF